jgi:adenylyltransferase/sulfurtransferase
MPQIGSIGQLGLLSTSVLIIGAGGLGAPAAFYLAAAGIGRIGIVDYDIVEESNLHRQIIHTESRVGQTKVESAATSIQALNRHVDVRTYNTLLHRENAFDIVEPYDIVLDCSDNVATRYLINDVCVLSGKPLISGSALRMEGQVTVYHLGPNTPCYRCIFPVPPPAATVTNCGDGGVLGSVPGTIGTLQATEAVKIAVALHKLKRGLLTDLPLDDVLVRRMWIMDAESMRVRIVKLRDRRPDCKVCGDRPEITRTLIDYEAFSGRNACDKAVEKKILAPHERITCIEYHEQIRVVGEPHLLLDVRDRLQFSICALPDSLNVPLEDLTTSAVEDIAKEAGDRPLYVICRRGNRSQEAVRLLQKHSRFQNAKDIIGGLTAWARSVDAEFPTY